MKKLLTLISVFLITISSFGRTLITTADVNFRDTPQITGKIICKIRKGTVIEPIEGIIPYNTWLPIEYNGKIGWVSLTKVKQKPGKTRDNSSEDYPPPISANFPN